MGLAFSVAPHMADAFLDDDVPAVMETLGPTDGVAGANPRCFQGCGRWAGPGTSLSV